MVRPLFSIIIPTYNRANEIGRCLSSVVGQTYRHWEAIIIDNYSEDNTEDIVKGFNDDRIKYFKNYNYGIISVSRNFGLDRAKGDWICFLDSDDSWKLDKLEQLLRHTNIYADTWGDSKNFAILKRYFKIYTSGFRGASALRNDLMLSSCREDVIEILKKYQ